MTTNASIRKEIASQLKKGFTPEGIKIANEILDGLDAMVKRYNESSETSLQPLIKEFVKFTAAHEKKPQFRNFPYSDMILAAGMNLKNFSRYKDGQERRAEVFDRFAKYVNSEKKEIVKAYIVKLHEKRAQKRKKRGGEEGDEADYKIAESSFEEAKRRNQQQYDLKKAKRLGLTLQELLDAYKNNAAPEIVAAEKVMDMGMSEKQLEKARRKGLTYGDIISQLKRNIDPNDISPKHVRDSPSASRGSAKSSAHASRGSSHARKRAAKSTSPPKRAASPPKVMAPGVVNKLMAVRRKKPNSPPKPVPRAASPPKRAASPPKVMAPGVVNKLVVVRRKKPNSPPKPKSPSRSRSVSSSSSTLVDSINRKSKASSVISRVMSGKRVPVAVLANVIRSEALPAIITRAQAIDLSKKVLAAHVIRTNSGRRASALRKASSKRSSSKRSSSKRSSSKRSSSKRSISSRRSSSSSSTRKFSKHRQCPEGCVPDTRKPCKPGYSRAPSGHCRKSK